MVLLRCEPVRPETKAVLSGESPVSFKGFTHFVEGSCTAHSRVPQVLFEVHLIIEVSIHGSHRVFSGLVNQSLYRPYSRLTRA